MTGNNFRIGLLFQNDPISIVLIYQVYVPILLQLYYYALSS